jgi:hypothetical protein
LALATAVATSSDREARAALQTPSVSINGPGGSIEVPSVKVEAPTPQVELPKVQPPPAPTAPAPPPVESPSLPVKPAPLPVKPPPLPVKPPPLPVKPAPLPVAPPSIPLDPTPLPGKRPSLPADPPSIPGGPSLPGSPRPDGGTAPRSGGSGPTPAGRPALPQAGGAPSLARSLALGEPPPHREWRKLAPAQRRQLRRLVFHAPPPKQRVRALRAAIRKHRDCLGVLPYRGRRTLELRAGLFGRAPASRRAIARRIGTSPAAVLRLERSSLRRLTSADERGLCGGGASGAAVGGPGSDAGGLGGVPADDGGASGSPSASDDAARDPQPASKVLADVAEGGPGIDLGDGEQGPAESLLFFLLALFALLIPLAAAAVAVQRRAGNAAVAGEADERPLLFLDVDGVVALDVFSKGLPPGEMRDSPLGFIYLPDRAGDLVRKLATRFDIVWATGWEHRANTALLRPLGLREELPALTFGKKARYGSSEWKLKRVNAYAGHRPAAWIDDNLTEPHAQWASGRPEPTLLVPVDPRAGLTPQDVDRLLRWADRVGSPEAARANGQRRASAS